MRKIKFAAMLWAVPALSQTPVKGSDTLQALLVEVHQLRQDIEGMTVASQRVQIALYALQMQDAAVARSAQRLDNARSKCSEADQGRRQMAADIQRFESTLLAGTVPEGETEHITERLPSLKTQLEAQTAVVQSCQAAEAEASTQFRTDQAKLADLQDRIGRLDKALDQLAVTAK